MKQLSEKLMSRAATMLALDKQVTPVFVIMKNGMSTILPADFENDAVKEISKIILWNICKTVNADAVFIVTEAWMTMKKNVEEFQRPSEDPDRIERLMVNYVQKNGSNGILYADIHRDENNDPYLTDSKWIINHETGIGFIEAWEHDNTIQ